MSKFLKFIVHFFVICTIVCVLGLALPPFFGVRTVIMDSSDKATNLPVGSVTYAIPVKTEDVAAGTLTVVDDQIGTPTYTYDLARLLVDMLEKEEYGKYHATNEGGYISWCDFAKEIFRQAGMDVKVLPVSSAEYPAKAKRPTNSRLEKKKLEEHGFTRLPDWKDALGRYLKEIQQNN